MTGCTGTRTLILCIPNSQVSMRVMSLVARLLKVGCSGAQLRPPFLSESGGGTMYHDPDSPSPACSIRSVLRKLFIVIQNLSDEQSISRISEASASLLTTVFSTVTYGIVCHQPHPSNGVSMSNFYRGVERLKLFKSLQ
jgi:hypothetical protein